MFNNFFQKPKKPTEYFAALNISEDVVEAAIFTIKETKAKILGTSVQNYSGNWDELIEATDIAVSKAAGELNLTTIKKVVFGFAPSFLDQDKISNNQLPHLKKLTAQLELIPSGFVATPEAINFYLEEREGGPQTIILIGVTSKQLTLSLFRGGKLSEQTIIKRSDNINHDIEKALDEFKEIEIFPSKILLYDGGDLETVKDELLKYPWQGNSKFLHFPKIDILSSESVITSVVNAAASELNENISSFTTENEETSKEKEIETSLNKEVKPEDLGFTKEENPILTSKDLNEDDSLVPKKKGLHLTLPKFSLPFAKNARKIPVTDQEEEQAPLRVGLPKFSLGNKRTKFIIGIILIILFLTFGYLFASYKLPHATIILTVDPKVFEQEKDVGINPDITAPAEATLEIPGKLLEASVSGTKTIAVTGKKIIGDPAKGSVIIYNKTTSSRVFEKGTRLSAKNLIFTLNDKVDVPAASESAEGLNYGKTKISVTAAKIGPEGNLTSQTEFTVSDFSTSSYSGRNEQAFSGGTSREVSAASAKDLENLSSQLTNELKEQAKKELKGKLVSGEKLLEESLTGEVVSRKFSHEADQETKELTLTMVMIFKGLIYSEKDFSSLMEKIVQANIPEGYEFKQDASEVSISDMLSNKEDRVFRFKAKFTAKLFPKIDTEKVKKEIAGFSIEKFQNYAKTIPYVVGYEIDFSSPLSLFENNLPKEPNNITIKIKGR